MWLEGKHAPAKATEHVSIDPSSKDISNILGMRALGHPTWVFKARKAYITFLRMNCHCHLPTPINGALRSG
jgi:hypothetical protein